MLSHEGNEVTVAASRLLGQLSLAATDQVQPRSDLSGFSFEGWEATGEWRFFRQKLVGAKFDGVIARGLEVLGCDASGSSWKGAVLDGARFAGVGNGLIPTVLDDATFADASATGISLTHVSARRASFDRILAPEMVGEHVDGRESTWSEAILTGGHFCEGSNAVQGDFSGVMAKGTCWQGSLLNGASFTGAQAPYGDWRETNVEGVHAEGADYTGSVWDGNSSLGKMIVSRETLFDGARLTGSGLTDLQRRMVSLRDAEFPLIPQGFGKQRSRRLKGISADAGGVHGLA